MEDARQKDKKRFLEEIEEEREENKKKSSK